MEVCKNYEEGFSWNVGARHTNYVILGGAQEMSFLEKIASVDMLVRETGLKPE